MKFAALSSLVFATQALGFAPSSFSGRSSELSLSANVLEGREITNDFTPINNMLLVKKVEVKDQTDGGLFLTGKVSLYLNCFACYILSHEIFLHLLYCVVFSKKLTSQKEK